jgi:2-polyprenyl-3-methyl-5-hydroxy-6-metoxy-1,4-benzoquinol methylase
LVDGVQDTRLGVPGRWDIVRCRNCGFEQTSPRMSEAELTGLYEAYYNHGGETGTRYANLRDRFFTSPLYKLMLWLDGDISFHTERGAGRRLLDVGCNEGRNLEFHRRAGFIAEGQEINSVAAQTARDRRFVVHTTPLAQLHTAAPYDRIVMSQVLEHVLDPVDTLTVCRRLLAPDGELWISVPNARSWQRRVFGRRWVNWHVPFHVSHFTAGGLTDVLHKAGFSVISIKNASPAAWMAQSIMASIWRTPRARSALLLGGFMLMAYGLLPLLWLGNRAGWGDCLIVKAQRSA